MKQNFDVFVTSATKKWRRSQDGDGPKRTVNKENAAMNAKKAEYKALLIKYLGRGIGKSIVPVKTEDGVISIAFMFGINKCLARLTSYLETTGDTPAESTLEITLRDDLTGNEGTTIFVNENAKGPSRDKNLGAAIKVLDALFPGELQASEEARNQMLEEAKAARRSANAVASVEDEDEDEVADSASAGD